MANISEDIILSQNKVLRTGKRKIRALFYATTLGFVLSMSSLVSLQMIQTSINIEGNFGAISVASAYGTSVLFNVFCSPALLHHIGPNVAAVLAESTFLAYCLVNLYPELGVLTAGAIVSGVGRSLFFPTYTILVIWIAKSYAELDNSKTYDYHYNYFQSRFHAFLECSSILGNGISYAILYGFSVSQTQSESGPSDFTTYFPNYTANDDSNNQYEHCGVNDCQDPTVIEENIDQYVPPDKTSIFILIGTACGLCIVAVLIHGLVFPGLGVYSNKLEKIKQSVLESVTNNNESIRKGLDKIPISCENDGFETESVASSQQIDEAQVPVDIRDPEINQEKDTGNYWKILKATGKFAIYPRPLMLHTSTLRHGMMIGFLMADVTRAYSSCVAGVETVGLFLVVFGVTSVVSAFLYGKLNFKHSRYFANAGACSVELLTYAGCFFWTPDPATVWMLFLIFIGFGVANGFFRQNIIVAYIIHFPENKNVSLSVFNVYFMGGIGIQYALSTVACVKAKIILQVSLLIVGTVLFVVAELILMKKTKSNATLEANIEKETEL